MKYSVERQRSGHFGPARAGWLKGYIESMWPTISVEVWSVNQRRAYLFVEGPLTRGVVRLCLQTEEEVTTFYELARQQLEPRPGSARWNDAHFPFGPDTTMA